jgi:uncharacterized SAM-binding protein YcdF (DUF218 family)
MTMISRTQGLAETSALDATEALGWGWASAVTSAGLEAAAAARSGSWRPSLRIGMAACVTLALCGLVAATFGFVAFVYSLERAERRPDSRADGIVALTGGAQRIGDAIDLLAQGYATRLLISGVNERTTRDQIARLNPGQRRLVECCVDLDYRARNTIGNAIETRRWAERNRFNSLIVVTSSYHMPRTLVELDHVLPGLRKVPYAVVTPAVDPDEWWKSPSTARVLFGEYVKFLAVWARTSFEEDPERSTAANFMSRGQPVKVVAEPLE